MIPKNVAAAERDRLEAEVRQIEFRLDGAILNASGNLRRGPFGADIAGFSEEAVLEVQKRYEAGGWYVSLLARATTDRGLPHTPHRILLRYEELPVVSMGVDGKS